MGKCLSKSKQTKSENLPQAHNFAPPAYLINPAQMPPNNQHRPSFMNAYPGRFQSTGPHMIPPNIQYPPNSAQTQIAMSPPSMVYQPKERLTRVKALFSYSARNDDDLDFNVGDILFVCSNLSEDWWLARHANTNGKPARQGYIPSNYVVVDNGGPESHDGWYNISRRDADRKLLMVGNPKGTFIIRPSSCPKTYALSIRHHDDTKDSWVVKHYKIRKNDEGGYFISARRNFSYILDLLNFYKENPDGLCCKLSIPCPRKYKPPVQFRDFEVNRECIQKIRFLGKGSFGEVFLAKWNNSIEVAVKTHLPTSNTTTFLEEAKTMHRLHHPRIVQLLGVCTKPESEPIFIITELMAKGALVDFLRKPESRSLTLNEFIDFMAQITDGMAYLESQNSIHRDLRAANILVDYDNSVKVSDFGLAKFLKDPNSNETTIKFPIKWTAPEAANQHLFSTKSDVWSFGILMYEIVTYGGQPYPEFSNKQVIAEIIKGYRMPNPNSEETPCSDDLYKIMTECWKDRPEQRPTFRHLHEVFDNWTSHNEAQYHD